MNKKNNAFNYIIKPIEKDIKKIKKDKYTKKMTGEKFIKLMIYAQINKIVSIRKLSTLLNNSSEIKKTSEIDKISFSQLSRILRKFDKEEVEKIYKKTQIEIENYKKEKTNPKINIIDSTTIKLCLNKYKWAEYRKTKSGIKIHLNLKFEDDKNMPGKAIVTTAKTADIKEINNIIIEEEGILNVFDRGYMNYKNFDMYTEKGILFTTRLKANAVVDEIEKYKTMEFENIVSDKKVFLGNKTTYKTKNSVRLIEIIDTKGKKFMIITNDFERSSKEISDIYKLRWKIELFFKWIKQNLVIKQFYGTSLNAIIIQIYIALIAYNLLLLVKLKTSTNKSLLEILRITVINIFENYKNYINNILKGNIVKFKKRKKRNYMEEFDYTEKNCYIYSNIEYCTECYI